MLALPTTRAAEASEVAEQVRWEMLNGDVDSARAVLTTVGERYGKGEATVSEALDAVEAGLHVFPAPEGHGPATDILLDVLRKDGAIPRAWRLVGDVGEGLFAALDRENGDRFYEGLAQIYPDRDDVRLDRARLALKSGRPDQARTLYDDILATRPKAASRALYRLAILDELSGDAEGAIERYREIVRRDEDIWARYLIVRVQRHTLGDLDAAEAALREADAALDRLPPNRFKDDVRSRVRGAHSRLQRLAWGAGVVWLAVVVGLFLWLRRNPGPPNVVAGSRAT